VTYFRRAFTWWRASPSNTSQREPSSTTEKTRYCTVLHYTVLYCILYSIILYCNAWHCLLYSIAFSYLLFFTAWHCTHTTTVTHVYLLIYFYFLENPRTYSRVGRAWWLWRHEKRKERSNHRIAEKGRGQGIFGHLLGPLKRTNTDVF
jgi:hypothetical protein